MTAKRCSRCADFGPYLYLLTCTRTCQRCLARCDEFIPAHMEHAKALIGSLPISLAAEIPSAMSLPGVYTTRKFDLPAKRLYDFQSLWSAGLQHHGSEDALISAIINAPNVECAAAHAAFREKWENQRRGGIRYGKTPTRDPSLFKHTYKDAAMLLQTLPQADCSSITRWQTVVGCPVFDLTLNRVEKGHYCKACEMGKAFPILRCRRYDEETFKLHLRDCGRIKEGFHPEYPYDLAREAGEDVDDERGSSYVFNFLTF
ncbi:hypothetical protein KVT40_004436 [Elsinoe batatas]|uniref:Uncharacterized protein n=1 Tax=Elsinoe batatas TaxID=2601811 RepID=A0A8K0L5K2_9PEZI|nr:hypothetical protein KVT40_004436 [Elsinoe batatas]